MASIRFFCDDIQYTLAQKLKIRKWLDQAAKSESHRIQELNYIFTSDERLLEINQQFLNHDTFTDIITFDNSDVEGEIAADIYISVPRVEENSIKFKVSTEAEMHRLLIHGLLHLTGYTDKSKAAKRQMTAKEDHYLSLLSV